MRKIISITIDPKTEKRLNSYISSFEFKPKRTVVIEKAINEFLNKKLEAKDDYTKS